MMIMMIMSIYSLFATSSCLVDIEYDVQKMALCLFEDLKSLSKPLKIYRYFKYLILLFSRLSEVVLT